jgi:small subunit ribosomal protein S4
MYTFKSLKKIVKKSKKKDGLFEQNFIGFMECSLPAFIYRSSFLPNMFESLHYVKSCNIAINKIFRSSISFPIKIMDIVTFRI